MVCLSNLPYHNNFSIHLYISSYIFDKIQQIVVVFSLKNSIQIPWTKRTLDVKNVSMEYFYCFLVYYARNVVTRKFCLVKNILVVFCNIKICNIWWDVNSKYLQTFSALVHSSFQQHLVHHEYVKSRHLTRAH